MSAEIPRLAITMGDPAGIGPEIILGACGRLAGRVAAGELRLLVIGHRSALHAAREIVRDPPMLPESVDSDDGPPLAFLAAGEELAPVRFGRRHYRHHRG